MSLSSISPTQTRPNTEPNRCTACDGNAAPSQPEQETGTKTAADTDSYSSQELTQEEKLEAKELRSRDREVRAHEMAHIAAGGQYVRGGAHFEYQTGPDGKRYAVGGEVSIDTSPVKNDPEATIRKMQVVRSAAIAPAKPSAQDRSVAAQASRQEAQARQELNSQNREENNATPADTKQPNTTGENTSYSKKGIAISYPAPFSSSHFSACG